MHTQSSTRLIQVNDAAERLTAAYDAIVGDPGRFGAYLAMLGRMHRYSPNNVALIYWQCEYASTVASYKHWQDEGRQVRKGETAIRIFAPVTIKVRDAAGEVETDESGNERTRTGFKLVPVFDISQTDGPDLPQLSEPTRPSDPLTEPQLTALVALRVAIAADGIAYRLEPLPEELGGFYRHDTREIVVNDNISEAAQLKTTIHEFAHALAEHTEHQDGKAGREAIAEGTAFVVCAALGLDTTSYSPAYIVGYVDTPDRLKNSLTRIKALSTDILDQIAAHAERAETVSAASAEPVPAVFCDQCGEAMEHVNGASFRCPCGETFTLSWDRACAIDAAICARSRTDDHLLDTLTQWLSPEGVAVPNGTDPDMMPGREDAPALIGLAFGCSANDVAAVMRWQSDREEVANRVAA
jgi:antirestriction protein ArdC